MCVKLKDAEKLSSDQEEELTQLKSQGSLTELKETIEVKEKEIEDLTTKVYLIIEECLF